MSVVKARPISSPRAANYLSRHCAIFARYLEQAVGAMSQWTTLGALGRGLAGAIDPKDHERVLLAINEDGTSRIQRQRHSGKKERYGTEVCRSEDKTVSVASIYDDAIPVECLAVNAEVMRAVECRLTTRRGSGTLHYEPIDTVTGSATLHEVSREGDIQIHCHETFSPDCTRTDGSTGAVHGIYDHVGWMRDYGDAELAARLQSNGYAIDVHSQGFSVRGIPAEVVALNSKRSRVIDSVMEDLGLEGAAARASVAERIRPPASEESQEKRHARWKSEAAALGFTVEAAQALRSHKPPRPLTQEELNDLACGALRRVAETRIFTSMDVERAVLRAGLGTGTGADDLLKAAARAIELCHACELSVDRRGTSYYATAERLRVEAEAMDRAERLQGRILPSASGPDVERGLRRFERQQRLSLGEDQRNAAHFITASQSALVCIDGAAGTGKTSMLGAAREVWQGELGLRVVGCAPSALAAQALQREANIPSFTLEKLLRELRGVEEKREEILGRTSFAHENQAIAYLKKALHPSQQLSPQIVVLDEASMVGPEKLGLLLERAEEVGFKVVLVGDPRQLKPVKAYPGTFEALCNKFGAARLTEIQRQDSKWGREQVRRARDGDLKEALQAFAEMGRLRSEPGRAEAMEQLVRDWKAVGRVDDSLILTHTRSAAEELNSRVQQVRLERGELAGTGVRFGDGALYRNDLVRFTANDSRLGVVNGEKGRVVAALPLAIAIATKSRTVILPRSRAEEMLTLAYAATTHAAQGVTSNLAFVLVEGPIRDESLAYVQLSRARGITRLYVDSNAAGEEVLAVSRDAKARESQALAFSRQLDPVREHSIHEGLQRPGRGR